MQEEVLEILQKYEFQWGGDKHTKKLEKFLKENRNHFSRNNHYGHITTSALIINKEHTKVLLNHHRKLKRWLTFGGHVDPEDISIPSAAFREVTEESGITDGKIISLLDINVHPIPASKEPGHLHFDICFLIESSTEDYKISEESINIKWFTLKEAKKIIPNLKIERLNHIPT